LTENFVYITSPAHLRQLKKKIPLGIVVGYFPEKPPQRIYISIPDVIVYVLFILTAKTTSCGRGQS